MYPTMPKLCPEEAKPAREPAPPSLLPLPPSNEKWPSTARMLAGVLRSTYTRSRNSLEKVPRVVFEAPTAVAVSILAFRDEAIDGSVKLVSF